MGPAPLVPGNLCKASFLLIFPLLEGRRTQENPEGAPKIWSFPFWAIFLLSLLLCWVESAAYLMSSADHPEIQTAFQFVCLPWLQWCPLKDQTGKSANKQNVTMLWQLVRFVSLISSKRLPLCCCENFLKPLLMPRHPPGAGSALLALAGASPAATSSPGLLLTSSLLLLLYCFSCSPPPCFYCGA